MIGKSRTSVTNILRLNQLEDEVKELVAQKQLEMGHARALLALSTRATSCDCAQQVVSKQMTVRQTEQLVKKCLKSCG